MNGAPGPSRTSSGVLSTRAIPATSPRMRPPHQATATAYATHGRITGQYRIAVNHSLLRRALFPDPTCRRRVETTGGVTNNKARAGRFIRNMGAITVDLTRLLPAGRREGRRLC